MHVVSDQLGRHKGRSWNSAGGSQTLNLSHCLFPSELFFLFFSFCWIWLERRAWWKKAWGWKREVGADSILHLAKDVKQSLRHTVRGRLWTFVLVYFLCLQQTHYTLKHVCRLAYKEHPVCYQLIQKRKNANNLWNEVMPVAQMDGFHSLALS